MRRFLAPTTLLLPDNPATPPGGRTGGPFPLKPHLGDALGQPAARRTAGLILPRGPLHLGWHARIVCPCSTSPWTQPGGEGLTGRWSA